MVPQRMLSIHHGADTKAASFHFAKQSADGAPELAQYSNSEIRYCDDRKGLLDSCKIRGGRAQSGMAETLRVFTLNSPGLAERSR